MTQEKIDRINELSRKSRTAEGLTPAEQEERHQLRMEYVAAMRRSLETQLDHTFVVEPDGTKRPLRKKGDDTCS